LLKKCKHMGVMEKIFQKMLGILSKTLNSLISCPIPKEKKVGNNF